MEQQIFMDLCVKPDGFTLAASGLQWLVQNCDGWFVGRYPDGQLLAIDPTADAVEIFCFEDFSGMVEGHTFNGTVGVDLPNRVLRQVAHAFGFGVINGVPVDEYFPDDDDDEDEDPPLVGVDIENGKPRLVEMPARRRDAN